MNLSLTLIEILNMLKADKSARGSIRLHESWRSNETEVLNSHHQLNVHRCLCKLDPS